MMGVYMTISAAVTRKYVKEITGQDNLALAHTGNFGYAIAGFIGEQVGKMKKGKVKSTEDINFPQHLQIFRNTFVAMTITMFIFFGIVYLPMGIMYELNNGSVSSDSAKILSKQN
jgi:PTS system ascorbate-specific IIC component